MKKLLNLIILTVLLFCCKDDDKISADGKFNTHENNRVSSLKMSKDEYSNWINKNGISNSENLIKITNDVYSHFPDKFDFIIFILNQENSPGFSQMFKNVSNNVSGIGMDIFDNSSTFGSSGKLKGIIQLTTKNELTEGPSLHEIMHNWGNNIFETEKTSPTVGSSVKSIANGKGAASHWGFTGGSTPGQLGGFQQSTLQYLGSDTYQVDDVKNKSGKILDPFKFDGSLKNLIPYNELELYLMGMIPISSVNDFDNFTSITSRIGNGRGNPDTFIASSRTTYTPSLLEQLLGKRIPDSNNSQKHFDLLVIYLTEKNISKDEWKEFDAQAERFERKGDDGDEDNYNFWEATNGIGSVKIGI